MKKKQIYIIALLVIVISLLIPVSTLVKDKYCLLRSGVLMGKYVESYDATYIDKAITVLKKVRLPKDKAKAANFIIMYMLMEDNENEVLAYIESSDESLFSPHKKLGMYNILKARMCLKQCDTVTALQLLEEARDTFDVFVNSGETPSSEAVSALYLLESLLWNDENAEQLIRKNPSVFGTDSMFWPKYSLDDLTISFAESPDED